MIIERYFTREASQYGFVGMALFTFAFVGGRIFQHLGMLMERGIPLYYAGKLLVLMIPSFLLYVIPMATLLGVLMALTRMNADREILVLKTSGIPVSKFLRSVLLLAAVASFLTASLTLYAIPKSIKAFKGELLRAAREAVRPRVREGFFHTFVPGVVLYVEKAEEGRLEGVMLFDDRDPAQEVLILARSGQLVRDEETGRVAFFLSHGEVHRRTEGEYSVMRFESYVFSISPEQLLREAEEKARVRLLEKEMSFRELKEKIEERKEEGKDVRPQLVELHLKFALPFSPFVLGILGLALGVQRTRSGRSFGLVLSFLVIVAYYALYLVGKALCVGGILPPWAGAWFANLTLLAMGLYLLGKALRENPILVLELLEGGLDALRRVR